MRIKSWNKEAVENKEAIVLLWGDQYHNWDEKIDDQDKNMYVITQ